MQGQGAAVHDRKATDIPINAMVMAVTVDDPYAPGEKIVALQSLRDDPLGRLWAHKQIDQARYMAGRRWQQLYELAQIGIGAMDPTKEPVDGGSFPEALTDDQRSAMLQIAAIWPLLGQSGSALIRDVLAGRMFTYQVAQKRCMGSQRDKEFLSRFLLDCLEVLAVHFRLAVPKSDKGRESDGKILAWRPPES